eukprot:s74_g21.t1
MALVNWPPVFLVKTPNPLSAPEAPNGAFESSWETGGRFERVLTVPAVWKGAELRLGRVQCHLRPDTARTLRRVANELSALLPAPQAVDMPEVMTQKAMPKDFDLSEEAFREATSSRRSQSQQSEMSPNSLMMSADQVQKPPRAFATILLADPSEESGVPHRILRYGQLAHVHGLVRRWRSVHGTKIECRAGQTNGQLVSNRSYNCFVPLLAISDLAFNSSATSTLGIFRMRSECRQEKTANPCKLILAKSLAYHTAFFAMISLHMFMALSADGVLSMAPKLSAVPVRPMGNSLVQLFCPSPLPFLI